MTKGEPQATGGAAGKPTRGNHGRRSELTGGSGGSAVTGPVVFLLILAVFLPRVTDLNAFLAPDENRWLANTAGFTAKLAHGQWGELLQQPHPGITTQWLGALTVRADDWTVRKLPLVIGQGLLILIIAYVFSRLWGKTAGLALGFLLALNPFLVAHTRVYAMDSLLSLFLILSIGLLLLWKKESETRYLIFAAFAGAAAFLSKLPGIIIVPFTSLLFFYWLILAPWPRERVALLRGITGWVIAFLISLALILPSFAIKPTGIVGDFAEFFRSDDYTQLHQFGPGYYLETLFFKTTPLHWIALAAALMVAGGTAGGLRRGKGQSTSEAAAGAAENERAGLVVGRQITIFLIFAILFIIMMMLGAKKGDRYVLPSFLAFDAIAALVIAWFFSLNRKTISNIAIVVLAAGLLWQAADIYRLHPHTLAYINPTTKPLLNDRRTGWGEGLDLAADYLNQKPNAKNLKVASYFPTQFAYNFIGETVPAHQWDTGNVDYVVLYRAMFQRGEDAWETDVLNQFTDKEPEKVIQIGGIEYAWIYAL